MNLCVWEQVQVRVQVEEQIQIHLSSSTFTSNTANTNNNNTFQMNPLRLLSRLPSRLLSRRVEDGSRRVEEAIFGGWEGSGRSVGVSLWHMA